MYEVEITFEYVFWNNVGFRLGCISKYAPKIQGKWVYLEILKQFSELLHPDDIDSI